MVLLTKVAGRGFAAAEEGAVKLVWALNLREYYRLIQKVNYKVTSIGATYCCNDQKMSRNNDVSNCQTTFELALE